MGLHMSYDMRKDPDMFPIMSIAIFLGILFLFFTLSSCTLSVTMQNINTKGTASEVGDEALSSEEDLNASVPMLP
jgi:hypothetical protein